MEQQKVKIKVSNKVVSENVIRVPKRTRELLQIQNNSSLEAWLNPFKDSRLVKVKQAFKEDIKNIPTEERENIVFISQNAFSNLVHFGYPTFGEKKELNISDKRKTSIGSDPEFAIYNEDSNLVYAAELLSFDNQIGSDGPLAELRADPGMTAKEHVNNLEKLILNIKDHVDLSMYNCVIQPFARISVESYEDWSVEDDYILSCGGHIHLGLTKKISLNEYVPEFLVNILDRTIGMCLHRLDGDLGSIRRIDCDYGNIPDYKATMQRLEWRSPTGTWLMYKDLAEIVLSVTTALIEKVTCELVNNFDFFERHITGVNTDNIICKMFPSLVRITENYDYDYNISDMLTRTPASEDFENYITLALESINEMVDTPLFEKFAMLMQGEPNQYHNFNSHFIDNWTNEVSVFDHLII